MDLIRQVLDKFFDNLNNMQREAVFAVRGPVLILAGAGSGKTTALINRIVCMVLFGDPLNEENNRDYNADELSYLKNYDGNKSPESIARLQELIAYKPIPAWKIAAVTFTNKAAGELKERLAKTLGSEGEAVTACTFHSFCVKLLRRDIEKAGYSSKFGIYDSDDSLRLIKTTLNELDLDEKRFPPKILASRISRAKDRLITAEEYEDIAVKNKELDAYQAKITAKVYKKYQHKLESADSLDFDDLIFTAVRLLEQNPDLREYYSRRFEYMMVDEFQDTNSAQYKLAELLCSSHKNLCVVGDDDQSIYKFRGAVIENILKFRENFDPNTLVIKLEQNYRSTKQILSAANSIIEHNPRVYDKKLWTENTDGDAVVLYKADDGYAEAEYVADKIGEIAASEMDFDYRSVAILYRMNAQSNLFERGLSAAGIPYRIIGGLRFYDRKEIKDILSYLHIINNPRDILHFRRAINEPKRGIGEVTVSMVEQIASDLNVTPFDIARNASDYVALQKKSRELSRFADMMDRLTVELNSDKTLDEFVDYLISKTGYKAAMQKLEDEGENRLANLGELKSDIARFADGVEGKTNAELLSEFLESISLYTDVDRYDAEAAGVNLLTVHSAKGLEWDTVFLVGMEDGIFPSARSLGSLSDMEEERRLAYVAVTRAKKRLFITHARERVLWGQTNRNLLSVFIKETGIETAKGIKPAITAAAASDSYQIGERIEHPKFGEGMIITAQKLGNDHMLEIIFDNVGTKKLMANFAKLKKLN
ncbi:MAG: UvrD-helicase domain-containing protein [Ruminococcus sp.]|jgi:DNA helicase-2/ATP-dependent DNA helicase PcrA|nr:UvrD-helicase domain-containing protein [Ruminococcus sp.]